MMHRAKELRPLSGLLSHLACRRRCATLPGAVPRPCSHTWALCPRRQRQRVRRPRATWRHETHWLLQRSRRCWFLLAGRESRPAVPHMLVRTCLARAASTTVSARSRAFADLHPTFRPPAPKKAPLRLISSAPTSSSSWWSELARHRFFCGSTCLFQTLTSSAPSSPPSASVPLVGASPVLPPPLPVCSAPQASPSCVSAAALACRPAPFPLGLPAIA